MSMNFLIKKPSLRSQAHWQVAQKANKRLTYAIPENIEHALAVIVKGNIVDSF